MLISIFYIYSHRVNNYTVQSAASTSLFAFSWPQEAETPNGEKGNKADKAAGLVVANTLGPLAGIGVREKQRVKYLDRHMYKQKIKWRSR